MNPDDTLACPECEGADRCSCERLDYEGYDTPPYAMCQTLQYGPDDRDPGDEDPDGWTL